MYIGHSATIIITCFCLQPVNMFPPTPPGFYDVYGNVWDWVEDHFNGLPGFEVTYLYNDFSTPCFDGRHTMMVVRYWCVYVLAIIVIVVQVKLYSTIWR